MKAEKDSELPADSFADIFNNELGEIKKRRRHAGYNESDSTALNSNLVGLALSGGGIRSATFSLGLLQGLRHLKLLHMFDYISTVSGGGYIGGWWSAWLSRNRIELRRKARSVKFKVDHIKSPGHLAVALRFPETSISEYLFKKLGAEKRDALKKHCVPKAALPSELIEALERDLNNALSRFKEADKESPDYKQIESLLNYRELGYNSLEMVKRFLNESRSDGSELFEILSDDTKRHLKKYCLPERAASEGLAKVLVSGKKESYGLNELLDDPLIPQKILESREVKEQLLDDSELIEFLRPLPYQKSDSCLLPTGDESEIVERWADNSGASSDEEKKLKQEQGYNSLSLLNQVANYFKASNDPQEENKQSTKEEEEQRASDLEWINRSLLETIYPNAIGRDIFPPPEKTELQRMSDYALDKNSANNGSAKQSQIGRASCRERV